MKRSVIIFLIIALVMIIAGLVLCVVGGRIAADDHIDLFARPTSEKAEVTEISPTVNRIVINLKDADVIVLGGYEEQSVSLTGFEGIFHEVSISGGTLTVTGYPGWSTALRLLTKGFSFDGLRFYTRMPAERTERPTVTLFLTGDTIRNYDITLESGQLTVDRITYAADYTISIGTGDVTMEHITGVSDLTAALGEGSVTVQVTGGTGKYAVTTGHGNLLFDLPENPTRAYSLVTVGGTVSFYGIDRGGTMTFIPSDQGNNVSARTGNGDITFRHTKPPVTEQSEE